jgi:glutamate dehydrogenase (NADP+)
LQEIWDDVQRRDPQEEEFQQAVQEVLDTMMPVFAKHPKYIAIMKRLVEPERTIIFRVRSINVHLPSMRSLGEFSSGWSST